MHARKGNGRAGGQRGAGPHAREATVGEGRWQGEKRTHPKNGSACSLSTTRTLTPALTPRPGPGPRPPHAHPPTPPCIVLATEQRPTSGTANPPGQPGSTHPVGRGERGALLVGARGRLDAPGLPCRTPQHRATGGGLAGSSTPTPREHAHPARARGSRERAPTLVPTHRPQRQDTRARGWRLACTELGTADQIAANLCHGARTRWVQPLALCCRPGRALGPGSGPRGPCPPMLASPLLGL